MMDLNALKQYMDFYKNNLQQPDYSAHNGFNPTPYNPSGDAANWAMHMMGGANNGMNTPGGRDFFGNSQQPSYTAPQQFNPERPPQFQPNTQIPNYLASFLRMR